MSVTLNNKFWIREFNCSCNFVDGQCWRPLKYSKPLLCAHKSIDNIEDFLELPNYDYELENVENYLDNYYFYNEIIFYFWIILGILFTILFVQLIYLFMLCFCKKQGTRGDNGKKCLNQIRKFFFTFRPRH
uniref:Uncharacterized protein n=1 Tax=Meloidogyne enterolobii TaxID=390850 RepID=A0A6V7Y9M0_MELEN|nr:unnamed protein product [Meloidogyne enterolobii]